MEKSRSDEKPRLYIRALSVDVKEPISIVEKIKSVGSVPKTPLRAADI